MRADGSPGRARAPRLRALREPARAPRRAVLAWNPRVLSTLPGAVAAAVRDALGPVLVADGIVETSADEANPERIAARVALRGADLLVVGGGDGTVGAGAEALMRLEPADRPPLAILPLGTANNVARSLGLDSIRAAGSAPLERAIGAALHGTERPFDLGRTGERYFAGSFAVGMDADILAWRNAVRSWTGDVPPLTGYPLYLASCAANALRPHGGRARLVAGRGREVDAPVYGALLLNVALYAGEFRFAAGDPSRDGALELRTFGGLVEYVGGYADAWRRQLAHGRGERIVHPEGRRAVRSASFRFPHPVAAQIDGEELAAADTWRVEGVSRPVRVRVPAR